MLTDLLEPHLRNTYEVVKFVLDSISPVVVAIGGVHVKVLVLQTHVNTVASCDEFALKK